MQSLIKNKDAIFEIKKKIEEKDNSLYHHFEIPNIQITDKTISIVMTASNRSKQTYFTLQTIQNSSYKEIQVIIVDDSDSDPIRKEELLKYPFYFDFLKIKKENKNWVNPAVNYNIGFEFIKGSKVIIQNAEVCHIGDVLAFMGNNIIYGKYYVCDVKATKTYSSNTYIYQCNTNTIDIYNLKNVYRKWYQSKTRLVNLHFLVGMTISTFKEIKRFSYDYSFGNNYDDDDFLLKIKSKNIIIVNLFHDEYYFGGIHLYHDQNIYLKKNNIEKNDELYLKKKNYMIKTGNYIDITDDIDLFYQKYNIIYFNNADIINE